MNVYIDCGAHIGKTVYEYLKAHDVDSCYAIEPSLTCLQDPMWRKTNTEFDVNIIDSAAWVFNGEVDFFMNPKRPCGQSATILDGKTTGDVDYSDCVAVPCFDFSQWLIDEFDKSDNVTLKMDIEGAEYDVLAKMHSDGSLGMIDKLIIEFHKDKFVYEMPHDELLEVLNGYDFCMEVATH